MKKGLMMGVLLIALLLSLSFVFAATNASSTSKVNNTALLEQRRAELVNSSNLNRTMYIDEKLNMFNRSALNRSAKNMTYGQCVSAKAEIKNQCKASMKDALSNCAKETRKNMTQEERDACKVVIANKTTQCQSEFKVAKAECAQIKHNFFETIGSMFK
jgi:hypothetical protein